MTSPSILIHSPDLPMDKTNPAYPLKKGFGHRSAFDSALINAAASGIFEAGREAKRIVEICCGAGDLLVALAETFPQAEVTGIDQFEGTVAVAKPKVEGIGNAEVVAGDVMKMEQFADESVDFLIGQATMHHLTHNLDAAFKEFWRVLRPGGKCMFTFEPLSHNHTVNIVRSIRNTRMRLIDESNLYLDTLEYQAKNFCHTEIQCFNLTGSYLLKALPTNNFFLGVSSVLLKYDAFRFSIGESALR
jgi:ubiquinone/menaquinone biosynthesis C-methylase UbiE